MLKFIRESFDFSQRSVVMLLGLQVVRGDLYSKGSQANDFRPIQGVRPTVGIAEKRMPNKASIQ